MIKLKLNLGRELIRLVLRGDKMNFIITGADGLIGTFLQERLRERGDRVLLKIDKRSGTDIRDISKIVVQERVDAFIHLASFCKINDTINDPDLAFKNNVEGMHEVMEFVRRNKIPKVIFTSSSRILSKEKNPYTASKIYGEELVKGYSQCYDINYIIIRPSTVYGPFNDKTRRLIDILILNALQDKELPIFGDENKTLDFTYIDDFIDGFMLAMEQKDKEFDISAGKGVNVSYLADFIISLAGMGRKKFYQKETAQPQEVQLDISKIKALGYLPKHTIEQGVKKTFDWYKANFIEIIKDR